MAGRRNGQRRCALRLARCSAGSALLSIGRSPTKAESPHTVCVLVEHLFACTVFVCVCARAYVDVCRLASGPNWHVVRRGGRSREAKLWLVGIGRIFDRRLLTWCACVFVAAVNQGLATLAFFGVNVNLVLFLTRVLGQSNGDAANNVSKWTGTVYMFSLIGAFLSDSFWGRYKTCAIFQAIFVLVSRSRTVSGRV